MKYSGKTSCIVLKQIKRGNNEVWIITEDQDRISHRVQTAALINWIFVICF